MAIIQEDTTKLSRASADGRLSLDQIDTPIAIQVEGVKIAARTAGQVRLGAEHRGRHIGESPIPVVPQDLYSAGFVVGGIADDQVFAPVSVYVHRSDRKHRKTRQCCTRRVG